MFHIYTILFSNDKYILQKNIYLITVALYTYIPNTVTDMKPVSSLNTYSILLPSFLQSYHHHVKSIFNKAVNFIYFQKIQINRIVFLYTLHYICIINKTHDVALFNI